MAWLCGRDINYFDHHFIFIDGNKEKYKEIFVECEKFISKNGIIVVDNIFNQGDVLNKNPKRGFILNNNEF